MPVLQQIPQTEPETRAPSQLLREIESIANLPPAAPSIQVCPESRRVPDGRMYAMGPGPYDDPFGFRYYLGGPEFYPKPKDGEG
jgi:hypothetical protein